MRGRLAALALTVMLLVIPAQRAMGGGPPLVGADNRFGFDLYSRLQAAGPNANVVISPISLEVDLQAAYQGARGSTEAGMATALHVAGRAAVARQAHSLLAALNTGNGSVQLSIADAVFKRQGFAFQPAFVRTARGEFGAKVASLDFTSPAALAAINGWVSHATHGTIPAILDRLNPQAVMYLLNGAYFHASWEHPFDPKNTRDGQFIAADGTHQTVKDMHQMGNFSLYTDGQVQAIGLPYAGNRYEMVILLPPQGTPLSHFASQLTPANWTRWTAGLRPANQELVLPRFTVTGSFNLNGTLADLGMRNAFTRQANFSGLCVTVPCRITQVVHKTYLSVGELGTTAAAATSVGIGVTAVPQEVVVDHPFVVTIRDTRTGAILFLGGISSISG